MSDSDTETREKFSKERENIKKTSNTAGIPENLGSNFNLSPNLYFTLLFSHSIVFYLLENISENHSSKHNFGSNRGRGGNYRGGRGGGYRSNFRGEQYNQYFQQRNDQQFHQNHPNHFSCNPNEMGYQSNISRPPFPYGDFNNDRKKVLVNPHFRRNTPGNLSNEKIFSTAYII